MSEFYDETEQIGKGQICSVNNSSQSRSNHKFSILLGEF